MFCMFEIVIVYRITKREDSKLLKPQITNKRNKKYIYFLISTSFILLIFQHGTLAQTDHLGVPTFKLGKICEVL